MTIRAVSALLAALAVAGCATTGTHPRAVKSHGSAEADQPRDFGTAGALLDHAVSLIAAASPSSLLEGIRLASTADALGAGGAAGAGIIGNGLLRALYPGLHLSHDGTGLAWSAARITSPFLARIGPAMALLDPDTAVNDPALRTGLAEAGSMLPSSPLPAYFLALLAGRGTGAFAEEHAQLDEALKRSPGFVPAAVELSRVIIEGGTAPSELPLLRHLASLLPTPAERFAALARAGIAAGQPADAADAAAQGLVLAPDDTGLALLRAQALAASGDWYRALAVLDAMLRRSPDFAPAILLKARLLHESAGNDPEALGLLADAQARFPADVSFLELQSRILMDENKTADAVAALRRAHDIDPSSVSVLSALAAASADARSWNEAAGYFSQIPRQLLGPAQLRLGWRIATGLADHELALYFAQELTRKTQSVDAIAMEARSMLAAGRQADALLEVDHALLAMSPSPRLASELHYIRSQAGSTDALQDLRTALRENPDNADALSAIADILAAQKDYRKAAEYARRAAVLAPGDADLARKAEDLQKLVPAGQLP